MDKQFADAKLQTLYDAYIKALQEKGKPTTALTDIDEELKAKLQEAEKSPAGITTKDAYGAYLGLVGKDGLKAVLFWRHGGNPVGIATALFINLGISLP